MTNRKITLLSVCAALLAICIIQGIFGAIDPVKTIKTDASPDEITITAAGETIELSIKNNLWYVGNDGYLANKADVDSMIKALQQIKVLDKVGRFGTILDERYELSDEKAKTVTAKKAGKEIASIKIGKTSSTGSQTYALVNGKGDILLLSGNLSSIFGKSAVDLRSKTIYTVDEKNVQSATVTMGAKTWGIENTAKAGEKNNWVFTGTNPGFELDQDLAQAWIQNVCFLNINSWISDSTSLPANKLTSFQLVTKSGETIFVDIYEKKAGDNTQYIGTSSATTHKFDLTKYLTEKFTKNCEDLKVKAEK